MHSSPPTPTAADRRPRNPTRRRTREQLDRAQSLRPQDIFALHGIAASTLHRYCATGPEENRLPSTLIGAWRGRRGIRLVARADLDAWLAWQRSTSPLSFTAWRATQAAANPTPS